MSPCALQRDGADSAQGLRRPRGWRGSAWNWGLSAGGQPRAGVPLAPRQQMVPGPGGTGCPCVTKAARGRLGVTPREPVLAAGTAAGMRGSGQSWQLAGAAARQDGQAGVWLQDCVRTSPMQEPAPAAGRGGMYAAGQEEAWRDLRSGTVGPRLRRHCRTRATGASPPVPAIWGLHLRAERDGTGVAWWWQRDCGTGRQTRLWHRRGGAA